MAFGQNMTQEIEKIIKGKQASVGVAIIHNDDIIAIANEDKYPTMSVFKFHIAVTALKKMEAENIPLDKMVYIKQKEMLKNTYSPLRDKYPDQGIRISYRDIIKYTVSISDNNTCDWLIRFVGGIDKVDSYIISWDKGYEFHGDRGKHAYGHYVMLQQLEHTISYCAIAQETSYRKYFDKRAFCVFRDSHA